MEDERDTILESMEAHNVELAKAFEKHRQIENTKWPEWNEDGRINPEDGRIIASLYFNHRASLDNILECAGNLKKDIENLEDFFKAGEEMQRELKEIFSRAAIEKNKRWTIRGEPT